MQLHGLPVNRLNIPMAKQIGKTIGVLSPYRREAEMIAGDFLRVRVEVDVSKPLCRGRKVTLDNKEELWVAFNNEKLPNFCYWCEMVCHDDKDCDFWLSSKGLLPIESQEFRAWMRATPFNLGRKTFSSIPGLEFFHVREAQQEDRNEEHGEQASPGPPSFTDHDEGRLTKPILNLETKVLLEKKFSWMPYPKSCPKLRNYY